MKRQFIRLCAGTQSFMCRSGVALLTLCLCVLFMLSAFAASTEPRFPLNGVDLQHKGSVNVIVSDGSGNPVPGGTLQLYNVALVTEKDGQQTLTMTDAFAGCGKTADDLLSDQTCAEEVAAFVAEKKPEAFRTADNTNGAVTFSELQPGAYLTLQSEGAAGYETLLPFFVFIPQLEDGEIRYDVTAKAKPVEPLPPGKTEISAEKKVTVVSGTAPKDTLFSFVLTSETPESPLPQNTHAVYDTDVGSMTVSRTGEGAVDFGTLNFSAADVGMTYKYTIREVKGTASHYTYDTTVYHLTILVLSPDGGKTIQVKKTLTDGKGKSVSGAVFRNTYDGGKTTPEIPRTGQLWWPVLLMLPAGILLAILGVYFLRRAGRREEEAL